MQRVAIIASLKAGARERAEGLLAQGPPFELGEDGFDRHSVFLSESDVVFVFEGAYVEWELDDLVSDFFHQRLQTSLARWRELVEGEPRLATGVYAWERPATDDAGGERSGF